jgi:hypothetical protein
MGVGYRIPIVVPRPPPNPRAPFPPLDPAAITGGAAYVTKPSGTQKIWSVDLVEATSQQAVFSRELQDGDLDEIGVWRLWLEVFTPTGPARTSVQTFVVLADDDVDGGHICECAANGPTYSHPNPDEPVVVISAPDCPPVVVPSNALRGVPGPQGPPGPSGKTLDFVAADPLAVWTIAHNFGFRPSVGVVSVGGLSVSTEIFHLSNNVLEVRFNQPFAGTAHLS